jgi:hypothetical protein
MMLNPAATGAGSPHGSAIWHLDADAPSTIAVLHLQVGIVMVLATPWQKHGV